MHIGSDKLTQLCCCYKSVWVFDSDKKPSTQHEAKSVKIKKTIDFVNEIFFQHIIT